MKKTNKLIAVLCIVLTILILGVTTFATFKPTDIVPVDPTNTKDLQDFGGRIVGVVRTVGIVVSVVILLVLGIKYMMGSAEEKADYKKSMIPYLVGAVLIFASTTIVGIVYDMTNSLNK